MHRRQFLLSAAQFAFSIFPFFSAAGHLQEDGIEIEDPLKLDKYLGATWRLPKATVLEIWPSKLSLGLAETLLAVADWSIPYSSRLHIRLTDGRHEQRVSIIGMHPDGDRISIIGNIAHPDLCRLVWSSPNDAFYVPEGKQFGLVDGITMEHVDFDKRGLGSAFLADNGGVIRCGANVIVRNFYYGFQARFGGVIQCAGTKSSNAGDANYFAFHGGHISAPNARADGAHDDAKGLGSGFVAEYGGTINAVNASASYNAFAGFTALSNGVIRAYNSVAEYNGKAGYYTRTGGVIVAHRGVAKDNCGEGLDVSNNKEFEGNQFKNRHNKADPQKCQR